MDFTPQGTDTCLRSRPTPAGQPRGLSSTSVAAPVTVLWRVGDCFAGQLRLVLVKIQPSQISVNTRNFIKTEVLYVSLRPTLRHRFWERAVVNNLRRALQARA